MFEEMWAQTVGKGFFVSLTGAAAITQKPGADAPEK